LSLNAALLIWSEAQTKADAVQRRAFTRPSTIIPLEASKGIGLWCVDVILGILRGSVTWWRGSILVDIGSRDAHLDAHLCEPYTFNHWICIYCGALFPRDPICYKCYEDPAMKEHTCDFDEALVEGICGGPATDPNEGVCQVPSGDLREAIWTPDSSGFHPGVGAG
jgi:hypothetical protein